MQCILAHGLRANGRILNTGITNAFAIYINKHKIIADCGISRVAQRIEIGDWINGETLHSNRIKNVGRQRNQTIKQTLKTARWLNTSKLLVAANSDRRLRSTLATNDNASRRALVDQKPRPWNRQKSSQQKHWLEWKKTFAQTNPQLLFMDQTTMRTMDRWKASTEKPSVVDQLVDVRNPTVGTCEHIAQAIGPKMRTHALCFAVFICCGWGNRTKLCLCDKQVGANLP